MYRFIKLGAIYVIDLTQSTQMVVMIVLLIEEINLMQVSLEIVRLSTTRKKNLMSMVLNIYIYIYIYEVCYLTEKEERKKIVCLLQELFLRFPNLCSMRGKL